MNQSINEELETIIRSSNLNVAVFSIEVDENEVLTIEVISDDFKGIRLVKRISMLSDLFLDIVTTKLIDYSLVLIPLTVNEKFHGSCETTKETENNN